MTDFCPSNLRVDKGNLTESNDFVLVDGKFCRNISVPCLPELQNITENSPIDLSYFNEDILTTTNSVENSNFTTLHGRDDNFTNMNDDSLLVYDDGSNYELPTENRIMNSIIGENTNLSDYLNDIRNTDYDANYHDASYDILDDNTSSNATRNLIKRQADYGHIYSGSSYYGYINNNVLENRPAPVLSTITTMKATENLTLASLINGTYFYNEELDNVTSASQPYAQPYGGTLSPEFVTEISLDKTTSEDNYPCYTYILECQQGELFVLTVM